ncbi:MAG: cytochrome c [Planctomycetota bacterium]
MKAFRVERNLLCHCFQSRWMVVALGVWACGLPPAATAAEVKPAEEQRTAADRGWQMLRSRAYLPPDFDQAVFDSLWTTWNEPLRRLAEQAPVEERRKMTMQRYGLTSDPVDRSRSLQYVVDANGNWTMSCLACHQGQVNGQVIPGVPNTNYALETLTEEVRLVKVQQRKPFGHMDMGSLFLPLGSTNGTTNAVMFGVALMRHRDRDLNIIARTPRFDLIHHDMDAPAWWHYARRTNLYADAFAPKGHRMLMQFLLVKENGPEKFREWEEEFRDVEAWIESIKPPRWPWAVDSVLVEKGRGVFAAHCATCHGRYESPKDYPEKIVAIDEVGTDRVRFDSLSVRERRDLSESWFGKSASSDSKGTANPIGYVAPPLDGIWASSPYFHNGSVPTLWHVLHPAERPVVWQRTPTGYDPVRVGLEVVLFEGMPAGKIPAAERRSFFNTTKPGKSAAGHDFPDALDEEEKKAVLEYLKTL